MQDIEIITLNKPGITDFAKERNELLKKARREWVFFLDSDEVISPALRRELSQLNNNSIKSINAFYVKRKNYFLGTFVGADLLLRLARKDAGNWERRVHEVWKIKGKVGRLKNPIIHNTATSVDDMIAKINYYSTLHAQANLEEGKKSNIFKIIFYPKVKFVQSLLAGKGLVLSILMAFHSFLSWSKLWISQKN
jgi:glycosyltransferase involved in cell wall biosynthesis